MFEYFARVSARKVISLAAKAQISTENLFCGLEQSREGRWALLLHFTFRGAINFN
jgi:hypothetical protein